MPCMPVTDKLWVIGWSEPHRSVSREFNIEMTQEQQGRLHVVLKVHSTVTPSRLRRAMQAVVMGREVLMHRGRVRHLLGESERFESRHAPRKEGLPVIAEDDHVGREWVEGKETA